MEHASLIFNASRLDRASEKGRCTQGIGLAPHLRARSFFGRGEGAFTVLFRGKPTATPSSRQRSGCIVSISVSWRCSLATSHCAPPTSNVPSSYLSPPRSPAELSKNCVIPASCTLLPDAASIAPGRSSELACYYVSYHTFVELYCSSKSPRATLLSKTLFNIS